MDSETTSGADCGPDVSPALAVKSVKLPPREKMEQALQALIASGREPSPENLVSMSADPDALLHDYFYSEHSEQEWADYGRYEIARKIIRAVDIDLNVSGKSITVRAVEFVRTEKGGKYATIQDIVDDPMLMDGYMHEVMRLLGQAQEKMAKLREIVRAGRK